MVHALQSELFRLRRRPQTWIMPILTVGFIATSTPCSTSSIDSAA
jgi:hypothetical protein